MGTLNLGILAHVDAGKTTLTERLLFAAGVIDEIGTVDRGTTQTDSLALEQKRGITIKSAVVSFAIDGVTVNLIDTPGHPDFIAEVERVLGVLDGVVLVVSAVEGVQAQTRVLMRTLGRLGIPTLIFVNKIDRGGAQCDGLLRSISEKLTPAIVPMGSVSGLGTRGALCTSYDAADPEFAYGLVELLADHDEALLAEYVDDTKISYGRLRRELAAQTGRALVHPVFFGSAVTGAGLGLHLEIPADTLGQVLSELARLRAVAQTQEVRGPSYILEGEIPAARVHGLQQQLPALTRGEGVFECAFDRYCYQRVDGKIPTRPRTDHNPLDPEEYLLRVARRV
jgi:small GTP-binding protein